MKIQLKRVYDDVSPQDGYRVLVDRLWPRALKKEALKMDLWAKALAPTPTLRRWFHADPENRWAEFCTRYRAELDASSEAAELARQLGSHATITLLFAAKDVTHSHARILKAFLLQSQE